ncbi:MAG: 50S ribosomal protein L37ae [Candidatus Woesearchaeota archaeon]
MPEKTGLGTAKRFGVRYGATPKYKLAKIEEAYRKKPQDCPYCHKQAVKRIAYGIWGCRKCGAKLSGKAYSIEKKIVFGAEKPAELERTELEKEPKEATAVEVRE